jgi:hypothetical protein
MARFGWPLIAVGLMIVAAVGARFAWIAAFDPDLNDPLEGMLLMVCVGGGLILAALGAVTVTKARGGWTPPI